MQQRNSTGAVHTMFGISGWLVAAAQIARDTDSCATLRYHTALSHDHSNCSCQLTHHVQRGFIIFQHTVPEQKAMCLFIFSVLIRSTAHQLWCSSSIMHAVGLTIAKADVIVGQEHSEAADRQQSERELSASDQQCQLNTAAY